MNKNSLRSVENENCFTVGQCHLTIITKNDHHLIRLKRNDIDQVSLTFSSSFKLLIDHNQKNQSIQFSSIINNQEINPTKIISTEICSTGNVIEKRALLTSSREKQKR